MHFQAIKGMRDFYPQDMEVRNHIFRAWRQVSLRNGFVEYDSPILESLDLYRAKSGDQIVEQLFHLTDRGGRELAIRPEMTPTLARMINARASSLPRPIKWFCMPRLCRAERPQRGRLREFFQWNIDIVGAEDALADAEAIFVAVDLFRWFGLTHEQVEVRINSRRLLGRMLSYVGIEPDGLDSLYALLDRRDKIPAAKFQEMLSQVVPDPEIRASVADAMHHSSIEEIRRARDWNNATIEALDELERVFEWLDRLGVADYCRFDTGVVRGLAYYTGVVFEAYGRGGLKRAVCGGGRYDDLLRLLGGPKLSGVGFATSDVVIQDLLEEFGLLGGETDVGADVFVIDADPELFPEAVRLVGRLREKGLHTEFSYRRQGVGKQLKAASAANCPAVVLLGDETRTRNSVTLKDLRTGEQTEISLSEFAADPVRFLPRRA